MFALCDRESYRSVFPWIEELERSGGEDLLVYVVHCSFFWNSLMEAEKIVETKRQRERERCIAKIYEI
jgi:hypothetical protein